MSYVFPPCYGPVPFNPSNSIVATMDLATAQANLQAALVAYNQMQIGGKAITVSVSQGDGSRTVSFAPTSKGDLVAYIRLLQARLGINTMGRRPIRFTF